MFDAYIQVFNKTDRLEKCLSSFRDFYPDSSIILFSDGGEDLTNVADSFSCRYFHSEVNTGLNRKFQYDPVRLLILKLYLYIIFYYHMIF